VVAFQYKQGLARGEWTTQAGASRALGVSQAELSMALRLDSLPAGLIEMFEHPGDISSHTVRVIRDVIARDGLETVQLRIQRHAAANIKLPVKAVLAVVKGRLSVARKALPSSGIDNKKIITGSQDLPRYISDRYHLGIVNGEWRSYSGCSRALRISRRSISNAVSLWQLPDSVRLLFKEAELTFAVGRKLLALEKELGSKELLARASYIRSTAHEHTAEHLLRELKGENVRPGEFSRLRIRKGRGTNRLIIEAEHAGFLFPYRREMAAALNQVVKKLTVSPEADEMRRTLLYPLLEAMRRRAGR
jgi:ParB-like chromosome segregation protein Spo0J